MIEYRNRIADRLLQEKLAYKGAVLIRGPKWCGKTTTALQISNSVVRMDDPLNEEQNLFMSSTIPERLLSGDTPHLIDEWQIAPRIWDAVRYEVDKRGEPGQFILTGSSVPPKTNKINHSGTGRFAWLNMRTMSLFESGESNGEVSLMDLFSGKNSIDGEAKPDIDKLAFQICRGGWPASIDADYKYATKHAIDYFDAVVNSDINRVDGVSKNPERVKRIMRSYSRNQGSQVSIDTLKNDIIKNDNQDISDKTIFAYINALKNIFVVEDMPAWNPNLRSKTAIRVSDTKYFTDPSIATASLNIGPEDLLNDLNTMGLLFETLCVRDLRIYSQILDGQVYHYRDAKGLECDCIIHLKNGKYGLVEIKLGGEDLIEKAVVNLKKLTSKIDVSVMNKPSFMMVLIGVGKYAYKRSDGVYVVPVSCLKY